MSGYRQSSFDPNAGEQAGRPMRPFNWVQWTGVGFAVASLAVDGVFFAGQLGWIRPVIDNPGIATVLIAPAIVLINSRRQPLVDPADREQRDRNRKMLLIAVLVLTAILGAVLVIQFSGAV